MRAVAGEPRRRVDAGQQPAAGHVGAGHEVEAGGAAAWDLDPELAELLAGGDRRLDRPAVDHLRGDTWERTSRGTSICSGFGATSGTVSAAPSQTSASVTDLALGEELHRVERAEGPLHDRLGLGRALRGAPEPAYHEDDALAVLRRRADQPVAGVLGVPGLQPVRSEPRVEQRVAVRLGDVVPGELGLLEVGVVLGEVAMISRRGEDHQVLGAHLVAFLGPAGGVLQRGVLHAELAGARGHLLGERLLGAGEPLGDHHAGVVAGGDDDAVDQRLDRDLGARLDEHARAAHRLGAGADVEQGLGRDPARRAAPRRACRASSASTSRPAASARRRSWRSSTMPVPWSTTSASRALVSKADAAAA